MVVPKDQSMNILNREREIFLGEDRGNVYEFARKMIDAGADVIFGHGPHVSKSCRPIQKIVSSSIA